LAAIEAGAAGCRIVTTDLGALPETCEEHATYVPYQYGDDLDELAEKYAIVLAKEIDLVSQNHYNVKDTSQWFNDRYNWSNRAKDWSQLFDKICVR
jgi:glycosyltransferase involved in cell wall biosynthesis